MQRQFADRLRPLFVSIVRPGTRVRTAVVAALAVAGIGCASTPLLLAQAAPAADAVEKYPEPSPYAVSWELKLRTAMPKRITVQLPGQKFATAYWYLTYTAINLEDKEQMFEPEFDMMDSQGKMHRGNRAIPNDVFEAIKKKEGNKLLVSPRKVSGVINPGVEQAKDSVMIWEEPQRRMGNFSIFVAGLSGEQLTMKKVGEKYVVVNAENAADELKDVKEEDRLILRKQLHLRFEVVGDENNIGDDPVLRKSEKWVMR